MTNIDPPAFIAGMDDTVSAMRGLCSAIASAPTRTATCRRRRPMSQAVVDQFQID
jgi:hypothetical protein